MKSGSEEKEQVAQWIFIDMIFTGADSTSQATKKDTKLPLERTPPQWISEWPLECTGSFREVTRIHGKYVKWPLESARTSTGNNRKSAAAWNSIVPTLGVGTEEGLHSQTDPSCVQGFSLLEAIHSTLFIYLCAISGTLLLPALHAIHPKVTLEF